MFQIQVDKNKAWVTQRETVTMYSAGYEAVQIQLNFSSEWSGLSKIAVFRAYDAQIDVAMSGNTVEIPVQALLKPNVHLMFGVYGCNSAGTVVIPTIWADLGIIQGAPNPTDADNYGPPALDLYAQVQALAEAAQAAAARATSGEYAGEATFTIGTTGDETGHLILSVTEDGVTTTADLGPVTAYAAALAADVDPPYTDTYANFCKLLIANYSTSEDVAAALEAVEQVTSTANTANANAATALSTAQAASSAAASAVAAAAAAQTSADAKQPKYKTATVTLASGASEWGVDQPISVAGVTASNLVIWSSAPESFDAASAAGVRMTAQGNGTVSFSATATTSEDIVMNLAIFD